MEDGVHEEVLIQTRGESKVAKKKSTKVEKPVVRNLADQVST